MLWLVAGLLLLVLLLAAAQLLASMSVEALYNLARGAGIALALFALAGLIVWLIFTGRLLQAGAALLAAALFLRKWLGLFRLALMARRLWQSYRNRNNRDR